jgi:hypothetical protein
MSRSRFPLHEQLGSLIGDEEELISLKNDELNSTGEVTKRLTRRRFLAGQRKSAHPRVKGARKPSTADLDALTDAVGLDPVPQERVTGDVLRGYGPRRGNLEKLLRYWRPIMRKPGGFRRCLVILADHPELYPLENLCAWLHHETTGLWPNEGCHHPGMKNCRKKGRGVRNGSAISDSQFENRMRKLKAKKKDAVPTPGNRQADIDFRALAYMTAAGVRVRTKGGLVQSNDRVLRTVESLVSFAIPGDMARLRSPIRSTLARAVTPGGGRDRIGGSARFRCPPGFAHGGKFTDRRFSTCGPRLFEQSGTSDSMLDATRDALREVANATKPSTGKSPDAIGAKKPSRGERVTPGDYNVPTAILRAAQVEPVGKTNPKKVRESINVNASLAYEERAVTGKLVRRDGSVLDVSAPISRIADIKDSDDMKDGYLISRVDDPTKMGDSEISTLATNLKGFVLALPGGNHLTVSKTSRATPEAMKGAARRFNALKNTEDPFAYGSALSKMVEDSKGALSLDLHTPSIKNPRQIIQVEREGATRNVLRWVFALFLSETAPARNKASKPWTVVTADSR